MPTGKITNSFLTAKEGLITPMPYAGVAREQNVTLIDLQSISAKFYEALRLRRQIAGRLQANASEKTHHSDYGSYEIAKCVLRGIVDTKLPLATGITEDFHPFDPNHPDDPADFLLPPDPFLPLTAPRQVIKRAVVAPAVTSGLCLRGRQLHEEFHQLSLGRALGMPDKITAQRRAQARAILPMRNSKSSPAVKPALKWSPAPVEIAGCRMKGPSNAAARWGSPPRRRFADE